MPEEKIQFEVPLNSCTVLGDNVLIALDPVKLEEIINHLLSQLPEKEPEKIVRSISHESGLLPHVALKNVFTVLKEVWRMWASITGAERGGKDLTADWNKFKKIQGIDYE